jgi:lipopolysaccharide/colanic/teichoic acid biosynthesis glycosyltransferase
MSKRALDIVAASVGLVLLSPLLLLVSLVIKLDSPGPVFFRQERIGRWFRPFLIYKFRTMVQEAPQLGGPITFGADPRITRVGRMLRKTKIDEFPQLINVLKGEMSLVGPRPEVRQYVEMFRSQYEEILRVPPGITDPASCAVCPPTKAAARPRVCQTLLAVIRCDAHLQDVAQALEMMDPSG